MMVQNMGARRNFRTPKKAPTIEKKQQKGPHTVKRALHNENNEANRPPYEEKVAKRPQYSKRNLGNFPGGGRPPTLATTTPPPPPAGAHGPEVP